MAENEGGIPIETTPVVEVNAPVEATPTIEMHATMEIGGASSESNAEAWAVGERHGVPVNSMDQTYHNNSKYYAEQAADAEAWAVGKRGGQDVGSADPAYHNNAKYYKDQVQVDEQALAQAVAAADGSAEDAEAWAVGKRNGTDVESTDPTYHENAKYHAQQASGSASAAAGSATEAAGYASAWPGIEAALKAIGIVVYNNAFYIDPDAMPAAT